jgi:hypothetical protein
MRKKYSATRLPNRAPRIRFGSGENQKNSVAVKVHSLGPPKNVWPVWRVTKYAAFPRKQKAVFVRKKKCFLRQSPRLFWTSARIEIELSKPFY